MANKYLEKIAERDHWEGAKKGLKRGAGIGAGVGGAAGAALGASTGNGKVALGMGALGAAQGALTGGLWGTGIGALVGSKKKKAGAIEKKAATYPGFNPGPKRAPVTLDGTAAKVQPTSRPKTSVTPLKGAPSTPKSITAKPGLPVPAKPAKQVRTKGRWRTAAKVAGGLGLAGLAVSAISSARNKDHEKKASYSVSTLAQAAVAKSLNEYGVS